MKKRMVNLLMCAVLCLGMVTTVMAEGSPETKVKAVTEIEGEKVELVLQDIADFASIYSLKDMAAYTKEFKDIDVAEEEIKNLTVYDVELPDEYEIPPEGIVIEFKDISIKKEDVYLMLHETDDGEMEEITTEIEDGSIAGRFTSLSPVIYFKIERKQQEPQPQPPKPPVEPEKEPDEIPEESPQPPIDPPTEPEEEPIQAPEPPVEPEKELVQPSQPPIESEEEPEEIPKLPKPEEVSEELPEIVEPVEEIVSPKTADTGNSQAVLCLAVLSLVGLIFTLPKRMSEK